MKDYDSAWKDIIKAYFTSFLSFYFPRVADDLDLTKSPVFLDKELQRLSPGNSAPGRLADLLVRVTSRSGEPRILYTHVEVQGRKEPGFAERLFQYAYRIYDKFQSFPITLVLLTDDDPEFLPTKFEITDNNRSLRVDFNTAKLLYFRKASDAPEKQENPFAFVTAAQLEVNTLRRRRRKGAAKENREVERFACKKRLILRLQLSGYSDEYIRTLLLFLDWIVRLPEELENRLEDEIREEIGGRFMPYVTSWERRGIKKGLKRGIEQGRKEGETKGKIEEKREVLMRLLERKFGLTPHERSCIVEAEDPGKLDAALDAVLFAETKTEVLKLLD